MQLTFFEALSYFFIYGFLGWCTEVVFAAFKHGTFVNRGFLLGPICPIYGFGVIAVLYLLGPLTDRPVSVYIMSVLITSAVELLVGVLAQKVLHERLWDYSNCFMNLGGYICLVFSLLWGVGCMAVIYLVQPLIAKVVAIVPRPISATALIIFSAMILTDAVITCFHALKIESRMKAIDEAAKALEKASDKIGKGLSENALVIKDKAQESEKLQKSYRQIMERRNIVHEHLFKSFDNLKKGRYKTAYEKIKKYRGEALKNKK